MDLYKAIEDTLYTDYEFNKRVSSSDIIINYEHYSKTHYKSSALVITRFSRDNKSNLTPYPMELNENIVFVDTGKLIIPNLYLENIEYAVIHGKVVLPLMVFRAEKLDINNCSLYNYLNYLQLLWMY